MLKNSVFNDEAGTFTDVQAAFRYAIEGHMPPARSTPPVLGNLKEGTYVVDKGVSPPRLYSKINGVLYYIAWTAA
jgi:hypothetical protein